MAGSRQPWRPTSRERFSAISSALSSFIPKVSFLNVLPSRQNVIWAGERHRPRWIPQLAFELFAPHIPLSTSGHQDAERRISGSLSTEKSPRTVQGDLADPLLQADAQVVKLHEVNRTQSDFAEHDDGDMLSMSEAVSNLSNTVLGVGVLSVPYAFRLSGYSCILIILFTIFITGWTANFIGQALVLASKSHHAEYVPRKGRDFAFLAFVGFGNRGRWLIGMVTSLEIWFALITYMVMNGLNASVVLPWVDRASAVACSCLVAAATVFVPMKVFSYLSLASSAALVLAAVATIGAASTMDSWANPYDHLGIPALVQLQNVPRSVGIIVFCFAGHPCFPIVHECMQERKRWGASVTITFFLAFVYYGGLGVFLFLVFGEGLSASYTQNIAEIQNAVFWRQVSSLAFFVKIQFTCPLLLNAILVSLWAPEAGGPEWPFRRLLALASLTFVTGLTAVAFANHIAAVASLTGSLFTMTTSVLFPALVHLRLSKHYGKNSGGEDQRPKFLQHLLVLAFGTVMATTGTFLSLRDLTLGNS